MFPSKPPMTYITGIEMCGNLSVSMANASNFFYLFSLFTINVYMYDMFMRRFMLLNLN